MFFSNPSPKISPTKKKGNLLRNGNALIHEEIQFKDYLLTLTWKPIRNIYLRISSDGKISLSAPTYMARTQVMAFLESKYNWIERHQKKISSTPPARSFVDQNYYLNGSTVYYLGEPYLLKVISAIENQSTIKSQQVEVSSTSSTTPTITITLKHLTVKSQQPDIKEILYRWYRTELEEIVAPLIPKWEQRMGVTANVYRYRRMTTRWGTCNTRDKRIWLSVELAKKPLPAIEYVLVHELVHLLERSHNHRFKALMTKYLPEWKTLKNLL